MISETTRRLALLDAFRASHGGLVLRSPAGTILRDLGHAATAAPLHMAGWSPFRVAWDVGEPGAVHDRMYAYYGGIRNASPTPEAWQLPLAVIETASGLVVGLVEAFRDLGQPAGEVGTGSWIAGTDQGRGIGTLARRILLGVVFAVLGSQRVETDVRADNHPSARVTEKLGFARTGTAPFGFPDGVADRHAYSLTRSEWEHSPAYLVPETSGIAELREYLGIVD